MELCDAAPGFVPNSDDCDDTRALIFPGAIEQCNDIDDDCDSEVDEDTEGTWWLDIDGDGYGDPDTIAEGCQPTDSHVDQAGDCDDSRSSIHPAATELCNDLDDNCDGQTDEGLQSTFFLDADSDGYGRVDLTIDRCTAPTGYVASPGDCDDSNDAVHPAALEVCNGIDDDCDSLVDGLDSSLSGAITYYADGDGDGFGDADSTVLSCGLPSGYSTDATDCNDSDSTVHPAATEFCDGHDDDCDGLTDESDSVDAQKWYLDSDRDGFGTGSMSMPACTQPSGYAVSSTDCDDSRASVYPGAVESCNGIDDDCDSLVDDDDPGLSGGTTFYTDADNDRYGDPSSSVTTCSQPSGTVTNSSDCNDRSSAIRPGATETCNGIDDDCDALVNDDDPGVTGTSTFYIDYDGDSYGSSTFTQSACSAPSGYVTSDSDCDDTVSVTYPGASEVCDDSDNDCDGDIDEGVIGRTAACAAESCAQISDYGASIGDGLYYLDPDRSGAAVWSCDMTTDGGGWTLVTDWNRVDDGDTVNDFTAEFDILQNNMGTFQTDADSLQWQACSSSLSWAATALGVSRDIVVPNDGEVLYEVDYEGESMDRSGTWFWGESAGTPHNLECWDHVDPTFYGTTELQAMPGYTCWASTNPLTFSWSGTVQDDVGTEVDAVRLSSLHYDGCGDISYLHMVELWVR